MSLAWMLAEPAVWARWTSAPYVLLPVLTDSQQAKNLPVSGALTQIQALQTQIQAATSKLSRIKQEMVLFNYVWYPTIAGRSLEPATILQWRDQAAAIGDTILTDRFNALVSKHDNASAIDLLTYIVNSVINTAN